MEATVTESKSVIGARKPTRLKEAEHERHVWICSVPPNITLDQVRQPDFWSHVGAQLRPCSRIEVMCEDMTWFAELMVISCDRLWAKTALLRFVDLTDDPAPDAERVNLANGYEVKFKGPTLKHVVMRLSDNTMVRDGIATKVEAEAWIREHVQGLSR